MLKPLKTYQCPLVVKHCLLSHDEHYLYSRGTGCGRGQFGCICEGRYAHRHEVRSCGCGQGAGEDRLHQPGPGHARRDRGAGYVVSDQKKYGYAVTVAAGGPVGALDIPTEITEIQAAIADHAQVIMTCVCASGAYTHVFSLAHKAGILVVGLAAGGPGTNLFFGTDYAAFGRARGPLPGRQDEWACEHRHHFNQCDDPKPGRGGSGVQGGAQGSPRHEGH